MKSTLINQQETISPPTADKLSHPSLTEGNDSNNSHHFTVKSGWVRWWRQTRYAQFSKTDKMFYLHDGGYWITPRAGDFLDKSPVGKKLAITYYCFVCAFMALVVGIYVFELIRDVLLGLIILPFVLPIILMCAGQAQGYVRWMIKNQHTPTSQ